MGTNNGHWEGDTLVVDVTGLNGLAWFDRAANFASDKLHMVERFTRTDATTLTYQATSKIRRSTPSRGPSPCRFIAG